MMSPTMPVVEQRLDICFDTVEFLRVLNLVQRRFDELTADARSNNVHLNIRTMSEPSYDDKLIDLASRVLGTTSWPSTLMCAANLGDPELILHCNMFLTECDMIVRERGLGYWISLLLTDALHAMDKQCPSDRMPIMHSMSLQEMHVRLRGTGKKRFGSKKIRAKDMQDYLQELCRWAALMLTSFATPNNDVIQLAQIIWINPIVGSGLVDQDYFYVHADNDLIEHARMLVEGLRSLQTVSDTWFEQERVAGNAPYDWDDDDHAPGSEQADRRFLKDAQSMIDAYHAYWRTHSGKQSTQEKLLTDITLENLWESQEYLSILAYKVMGPTMGVQLIDSIEKGKQEECEINLRSIQSLQHVVQDWNIVMAPLVLLGEHHLKMDAYEQLDLEEESQAAEKLRMVQAICDCVVMIALAYFPYEPKCDARFICRAVCALLTMDLESYRALLLQYFDDDDCA